MTHNEFPPVHFHAQHFSSDFGGDPVKDDDYPQWVEPHASHIVTLHDRVSTPAFPEFHVDRNTHKVTVLVRDIAEHRVAFRPWEGNPNAEPGIAVDLDAVKSDNLLDPDLR